MKKDSTLIVAIIDRSGSMVSLTDETIKGFNKFLDEQKKLSGEARMTLVQFNQNYRVDYQNVPLESVHLRYEADGYTALLDAMGKTIVDVGKALDARPEAERPEKVIVLVITDGMENSSKEYRSEQIREMVKHQQEKYGWAFIFLGANMDAIAVAQQFGIAATGSATYAPQNVGAVYGTVSANTARIRSSGAKRWKGITDEERTTLTGEKK